jgi:hypothetical protein
LRRKQAMNSLMKSFFVESGLQCKGGFALVARAGGLDLPDHA